MSAGGRRGRRAGRRLGNVDKGNRILNGRGMPARSVAAARHGGTGAAGACGAPWGSCPAVHLPCTRNPTTLQRSLHVARLAQGCTAASCGRWWRSGEASWRECRGGGGLGAGEGVVSEAPPSPGQAWGSRWACTRRHPLCYARLHAAMTVQATCTAPSEHRRLPTSQAWNPLPRCHVPV